MFKKKLYQSAVELTNKNWSSNCLKVVMGSSISKKLIKTYINVYDVNTQEVSKSIASFENLQQFFTRELKDGARPIDGTLDLLTSPADSKIESFGTISSDTKLRVKGQEYDLTELLGKEENALTYKNGKYIVFYLSPADYHRVHSPADATISRQYILGRHSYPVNRLGLVHGKKPISGNYRMISELVLPNNTTTAFIKVGAMFVNTIELTNTTEHWAKGEDIGQFAFGSTVVMLFEDQAIEFLPNIQKGQHIHVGEAFCNML